MINKHKPRTQIPSQQQMGQHWIFRLSSMIRCKLSSRVLATPPTNIIRGRTLGCWGSSGRNKVDQRWMCECVCQMYAGGGHVVTDAQLKEKQRTERMTRQNHVGGAFGMIFRRNTYIITTPIRPWADKSISVGRTALARMPGVGSRTKVLGDFKSVSVAIIITTSKQVASRAL